MKLEQSKSRQHFSAELEKGRAAIDKAAQRATEAEHRALREIDRERAASAQADKHLEQSRAKSAESERKPHTKRVEANAGRHGRAAEPGHTSTHFAELTRVHQ